MCKSYIPGAFLTALSWLAIHHLPGIVTHSSTALLLCRMWMRLMNVNEANSAVLARPPATLNLTWRYFIANVNCDLSQRRAEWMCFLCEGYSRCQMVVVMSFTIPNLPRVWLCTLAYYAACISMIQEIVWSPVLWLLTSDEMCIIIVKEKICWQGVQIHWSLNSQEDVRCAPSYCCSFGAGTVVSMFKV